VSRNAVIDYCLDGLRAEAALQGVRVLRGVHEEHERSVYVAVGVLVDGTLTIPTMKAGRKDFDDKWVLPFWINVFSERADGTDWVAQRYDDLFTAVVSWVQDNVTAISTLPDVLSIGGDDNEIRTTLTGPGSDENGTRAFGSIELPIHQRLN